MTALFDSGFTVGARAWHKLDTNLKEPPKTIEEGLRLAGLDWLVEKTEFPNKTYDGYEIPDSYTIRRQDTKKVLGTVGKNYVPLQNYQIFGWFDEFIKSGECSFECAGSLDGNKKVWVLAKINGKTTSLTDEDKIEKYLLLSSSHDGSLAIRVGFTPIRVVCWNTLTLSHKHEGSTLLKVRHGRNSEEALEAVKQTLNLVDTTFEATLEQYKTLISHKVNPDTLHKYIKIVLGIKKPDHELHKKTWNKIDEIKTIFYNAPGQNLQSAKNTWWGAYNAVTYYLSNVYGRTEDARLNNLWFGKNATINEDALDIALDFCGV